MVRVARPDIGGCRWGRRRMRLVRTCAPAARANDPTTAAGARTMARVETSSGGSTGALATGVSSCTMTSPSRHQEQHDSAEGPLEPKRSWRCAPVADESSLGATSGRDRLGTNASCRGALPARLVPRARQMLGRMTMTGAHSNAGLPAHRQSFMPQDGGHRARCRSSRPTSSRSPQGSRRSPCRASGRTGRRRSARRGRSCASGP